jgi:hypothetical protein
LSISNIAANLKLPFVIPPPVVDCQPYEWFLARSTDGKRLMIILTVNHIVIAHGEVTFPMLLMAGFQLRQYPPITT